MAKALKTVERPTPGTLNGHERTSSRPLFVPPADIYETTDNIVLLVEMPGVAMDGLDITLEKRLLSISGRVPKQEHKGYRQVYAEYADGDYERAFTLSEDIDRDRIEATLSNGVLRLVLPKAESVKAKKIEVKSA
jgi:HSP20 family protein